MAFTLQTHHHVPVQSVLTGSMEAEFSSAKSSPCNSIPCVVQTAKRTLGTKVRITHLEESSTYCCTLILHFRQQSLTASPDTFGSRFSCGTSTSSIRIMPVADALSENLPSILGVEKPFIPRSKMKPRTRPSSHLAHTTAMSATGEFVILTKDGNHVQFSS